MNAFTGTNALSTFKFSATDIRIVVANGDPWFIARDVCDVLGFNRMDNAHRSLSEEQKGKSPHQVRGGGDGRLRIVRTISESGLYKLVMRSGRPI